MQNLVPREISVRCGCDDTAALEVWVRSIWERRQAYLVLLRVVEMKPSALELELGPQSMGSPRTPQRLNENQGFMFFSPCLFGPNMNPGGGKLVAFRLGVPRQLLTTRHRIATCQQKGTNTHRVKKTLLEQHHPTKQTDCAIRNRMSHLKSKNPKNLPGGKNPNRPRNLG